MEQIANDIVSLNLWDKKKEIHIINWGNEVANKRRKDHKKGRRTRKLLSKKISWMRLLKLH